MGEFVLDPANECLWRGDDAIALRPKAFALLSYFADNPGRILTKQELLDEVWPGAVVGDSVLKVCVRELRQALGDTTKEPAFIETVHRRGYRFLVETRIEPGASPASGPAAASTPAAPVLPRSARSGPLAGRDEELARLRDYFESACRGERQLVFVTGAPGIGKTALIEAFAASHAESESGPPVWFAHGQCLEQFGTGEPYLPVLEALGRLCRGSGGASVVAALTEYAPTWLTQMPWLVEPEARERLQKEVLGATQERMLREVAEALVSIGHERPVVLVLEDVHWCDSATLDLVALLARRRDPARLMIIATLRPVEVLLHDHAVRGVKQELEVHGLCMEVRLELLDLAAVEDILRERFGDEIAAAVGGWLHRRTDGNPLFLQNVLAYLVERESLVVQDGRWRLATELGSLDNSVPENLRRMIEDKIERRSEDERALLDAASVAGLEFTSEALSAALGRDTSWVERVCEDLVRRSTFLASIGTNELPSGKLCERYAFSHGLYQDVLYQRIPASARCAHHVAIGQRGIAMYGDQVGDIAAELANHFESGRDFERAVDFFILAAQTSAGRIANREAMAHLEHALSLCDRLQGEARDSRRMRAIEHAGVVARSMGDMPRAAGAFDELAASADAAGRLELWANALLYRASALSWIDRTTCLETVERVVARLDELEDQFLRAHVEASAGYWHLLWSGWRARDADKVRDATEVARRVGDCARESQHTVRYAFFLCLRSEYDEAVGVADRGIELATQVRDSFDFLLGHFFRAWALLHAGRWGEMQRELDGASRLAERNGHDLWALLFDIERAWLYLEAHARERAVELAQRCLAKARALEHIVTERFSQLVLGRALAALGRGDESAEHLSVFRDREAAREPYLMGWILAMPGELACARLAIEREDADAAIAGAERLARMARVSNEETYVASAELERARGAHLAGDASAAGGHLQCALELVESRPLPLAEWRVHSYAAERAKGARRTAHRRQAKRASERLRASLDEGDPLADALDERIALLGERSGSTQ